MDVDFEFSRPGGMLEVCVCADGSLELAYNESRRSYESEDWREFLTPDEFSQVLGAAMRTKE